MKSLIVRLKEWLGKDGHEFFNGLLKDQGVIGLAILWDGKIPHPVHFREGMKVRNWLRRQPECKDWDAHYLDDHWAELVKEAIK